MKKKLYIIFLLTLFVISSFFVMSSCEKDGESPVSQIVITTQPKTTYYLGDSFDTNNSLITLIHENGRTETFPLDISMISGFNPNRLGEQILTIRQGEAFAYLSVNVITPPIYTLQVNSTNHKAQYVVGEEFDATNLTLLVTYSNGLTATVPVESSMISGFDSSTTGQKQAVIIYQQHQCYLDITVVEKSIASIQLTAPEKLTYIVGDAIDLKGANFFISYNDNTAENVDIMPLFEKGEIAVLVNNEDNMVLTKKQLQCTVKIFYLGREFAFAVTVDDLKVTGIAILTDVGDQIMGSPDFDFSKGVIFVTYNNKETEELSFYSDKVTLDLSGCDISSVGKYTMGITVIDSKTTYLFDVVSASPVQLLVFPEKNIIYQNERIDISNWTYRILLNNGNYQRINGQQLFSVTEDMFVGNVKTDIDNFKIGKHEYDFRITATNAEILDCLVEIEVLKKEIVSLEVDNRGKTVYSENDEFSVSNTFFRVIYNNGDVGNYLSVTREMLRLGENGEVFDENVLLASAGNTKKTEKTVYIYYSDAVYDSDAFGSYNITLVKKAVSIEFFAERPKNNYVLGTDFTYKDWQVFIRYADNTTSTYSGTDGGLDGEEWAFEFVCNNKTRDAFDVVGTYSVNLYYGGGNSVCLSYPVTVTNDIVDVYANTAHFGFITEGTVPLLRGMSVILERENGDKEEVVLNSTMIGQYITPAYKHNGSSFLSSYIDADNLAKYEFKCDNWENTYGNFYINNNGEYTEATSVYNENVNYAVNLAAIYKDNWETYKRYFYYDDNGTKKQAIGDYTESEYFINNTYDLAATVSGETVVLPITVIPKKIVTATVTEYKDDYIRTETDWDIGSVKINIRYNNGTQSLVSGVANAGNPIIVSDGTGGFYFQMNGMSYPVEFGNNSSTFLTRTFADFTASFDEVVSSGDDIFYFENMSIRIKDAVSGDYIVTNEFEVSCFEKLITNIQILVGEYTSATSTFTMYDDQTIYLNENKNILADGFVLDDSGTRRSVQDYAYIYVESELENGTKEYAYYKFGAASDASVSFYLGNYAPKSAFQNLTVGFLRLESSTSLAIRLNRIKTLTVDLPSGELSVIENMNINSNDINIYAGYRDADDRGWIDENGIEQDWTFELDLKQVTCSGYRKNDVWVFDENETSKNVDITISYKGLQQVIPLIVKPKSLLSMNITTIPYKTLYIEKSDLTLDYTGGQVSLIFDNGTTQILNLERGDIAKNTGEFTNTVNGDVELTDGIQQSINIFLSYTYRGVTKDTSYNVIFVDRKYVNIEFDSALGIEKKISFEYGTGESILPKPTITYYETYTDIIPTAMEKGEANTKGCYFVQYRDINGVLSSDWPTQVGLYTVRYTYFYDEANGDVNNNAFCDETVTMEITKRPIAVKIDDINVTYGDTLQGNTHTAFVDLQREVMGAQRRYWTITAVENGVANGIAYKYNDSDATVIKDIKFNIYEEANGELIPRELSVLTVNGIDKSIMSLPVGEYVVKAEITLYDNSNYIVSNIVSTSSAILTVLRRPIVLVAKQAFKNFGTTDPQLDFKIYDYNECVDNFGVNISNITAAEFFAAESQDFVPIGDSTGVYYVYDVTNYSNGAFTLTENVIFRDRITNEYHLSRRLNDTENVYDLHTIYAGPETVMSNYSITYVDNLLTINAVPIGLSGRNVVKYFGTKDFTTGKAALDIYITDEAPAVGNDTFEKLFADYFLDDAGIIYYNEATGAYNLQIAGLGNNWHTLYKNIKFFKDENCTVPVGTYERRTFTLDGEEYDAYYGVLPISLNVGTYYAVIDIDNINKEILVGLKNYNIQENDGYSFSVTVKKTNASINSKSFVLTGNSTLRDQQNGPDGRLLASYFEVDDISINMINRVTFDSELDEFFKLNYSGINYYDDTGVPIDYILSESVLFGEIEFARTDRSYAIINTGIHAVSVTNRGTNFEVDLRSYKNDRPYVETFYEAWGKRYNLINLRDNYSEGAYLVVLPEYIDFQVNQTDLSYDDYGTAYLSYEYTRQSYTPQMFEGYYSYNGYDYEHLYDTTGIQFSLRDQYTNQELNRSDILYVGDYNCVISYSFFRTPTLNYFYLGDIAVLEDTHAANILNCVFDRSYVSTVMNSCILTKEISYYVTPAQLELKVETETGDFDNVEKILNIELCNDSQVYEGDTLVLSFDIQVLYNGRTEKQTYTDTAVGSYRLNNNVVTEYGVSVQIFNVGVYEILVKSIGNNNYELTESTLGVYTIKPIQVPVYINTNSEDALTITKDYQAGSKGINPLDANWKPASSSESDYTYRTNGLNPCYIVKEYYVGSRLYTTNTDFVPNNLVVSTAQKDGSYPKNVKRNEDTREVEGYPIGYTINNVEYSNYSVLFVTKQAGVYRALNEDEKYSLVIQPKTVNLYGFYRVNSKVYDGTAAFINPSDATFTYIGDYKSDPIVKANVKFNFYRPESSMYIGDYKYIRDEEAVTAEENITDAGIIYVKLSYTDEYGYENYSLIFADEVSCLIDSNGILHNDIGIYTIEQDLITIDLKQVRSSWLGKQYDGYGLLNPQEPSFSGIASQLYVYGSLPVDPLDEMYYKLLLKRYGTTPNSSVAVSLSDNEITETHYGSNRYDVGYYWYDLRGAFLNEEEGVFYTFESMNSNASNWLSWNYRFYVQEPTSSTDNIDYHSCDGIYHIEKRDVFVAFNTTNNADGTLKTSVDTENVPIPNINQTDYNYKFTYDGYYYQAGASELYAGTENEGLYIDFKEKFNNKEDADFRYALYTFDEISGLFTDVTAIPQLKDYYLANIENLSDIFSTCGGNAIRLVSTEQHISAEIGGLVAANPNFNIVNSTIDFSIRPKNINLILSLVRFNDSLLTEMTYGTVFDGETDGLYFRFQLDGPYSFNGNDTKLTNLQTILTNIVNRSTGQVMLLRTDDNSIQFSINMDQASWITKTINGEEYAYVKVADSLITRSADIKPSKLIANRYTEEGEPIQRYKTGAANLSTNAEYTISVSGTDFTVKRKEMNLLGVTRTYFDKETDHYTFTVDGVENEEANDVISTRSGVGYNLKDYLEDNTSIATNVGGWSVSDKTYYIKIPRTEFKVYNANYMLKLDTSGSYATTVSNVGEWNINKPVYIGNYVYVPLNIEKAEITVDFNVKNDVAYGNVIVIDASANEDADIVYTGMPTLNDAGSYSHINHITQTLVYEEQVFSTGKVNEQGQEISLQQEQQVVRSAIRSVFDFDLIRRTIALSEVKTDDYVLDLSNYVNSLPEFDNYNLTWGNMTYKIIKKKLSVRMKVIRPSYLTGIDQYSFDRFSALWSEKDKMFYTDGVIGDNLRLGYGVTIDDFSINSVPYNSNSLLNQMLAITKATVDEETGKIVFDRKEFNNLIEFMQYVCKYQIYDMPSANNNILATSGGAIRYVGLYGIDSDNFELNFVRSEIMLYPEITGIGSYTNADGQYINLIPNTEASTTNVSINTGSLEITGMSLLFRVNLIGLEQNKTIQYADTNKTDDFNLLNYTGMSYNRTIKVVYMPNYSVTDLSATGWTFRVGDTITVKLIVEETFYGGEFVRTFESKLFEVLLKESGSKQEGYKRTIEDRTTTVLVSTSDSHDGYGQYLSQTSGKYYLSSNEELNDAIEANQDIINLRIRAALSDSAIKHEFNVILYEDETFGQLLFGFDGSKYYLRMVYYNYYFDANNLLDENGDRITYDGAECFEFLQYNGDYKCTMTETIILSDSYSQTQLQIETCACNCMNTILEYINSGWCSEVEEKIISGYDGKNVHVKYDDCNPFGLIAGEFGDIANIYQHGSTISDEVIAGYNSLGESFETFISEFTIPANETYNQDVFDEELRTKYLTFYNSANQLFSDSKFEFTSIDALGNIAQSALLGANYPYAITFGSSIDLGTDNWQTIIARLFGFNDTPAFIGYAQTLAETYATYRTTIENDGLPDDALDNGCFYTENNMVIFPIAIKNEENEVLTYVIIDTNDRVTVWINDIAAALCSINYNETYNSGKIIHNELYCKIVLYFTGPRADKPTLAVETEAVMENSVLEKFDELSASFTEFIDNYNEEETVNNRNTYNAYFDKAKALFGNLNGFSLPKEYTYSDSAVIGLGFDNNFIYGEQSQSYNTILTVLAHLMCYSDANLFNEYSSLLKEYLETQTSIANNRIKYTGTVYCNNGKTEGMYILPYAFENIRADDMPIMYVLLLIDKNTEKVYAWLSDVEAAIKISNYNNVLNIEAGGKASVKLHGRCDMFQSRDISTIIRNSDIVNDVTNGRRTLYEVVGNGLKPTTDRQFQSKTYYYINDVKTDNSLQYINYYQTEISQELVELFDGGSHSLSFYIDKVGQFSNISHTASEATMFVDEYKDSFLSSEEGARYKMIVKTENCFADRIMTVRVMIDNSSYVFTYVGEPFIHSFHSEEFVDLQTGETVSDSEIQYSNLKAFSHSGKTAIDYTGLNLMVNKYTIQNRLIGTAASGQYIANVLFWPAGENDGDTVYITNDKSALTIFEILENTVGNITICGGDETINGYNSMFTDTKKIITVDSESYDIRHNLQQVSENPGLYTVYYNSYYNYYSANKVELSDNINQQVLKIFVTDNASKVRSLSLVKQANTTEGLTYEVSSSAPVTFNSGTYVTGDLKDEISNTAELTFIFDNVEFESDNSNIWIYFKLSNTAYTDLLAMNSALTDDIGIGLRIARTVQRDENRDVISDKTYANVVLAQHKPIDIGGGETETRYSQWIGNAQEISFDSDIVNIVKIYLTRVGDSATGTVLNPNDGKDTVITFNLYQHNKRTNETNVVFQDSIRRGFGTYNGDASGSTDSGIPQEILDNNFFAEGLPHYAGFTLNLTKIRLMDYYKGTPISTKMDYIQYTITNDAVNSDGAYVETDARLTGSKDRSTGFKTGNNVFILTDNYNVPYSYLGNTVNLKFKLDVTDEGEESGFRFYFGMNTPYITNKEITDTDYSPSRQRGLVLEYNAKLDRMVFYYYKYNTLFLPQVVFEAEDGFNYNDGKEHDITVFIDLKNDYFLTNPDGHPSECYIARVLVEKKVNSQIVYQEKDVYVPISNNLTGLTTAGYTTLQDNEQNKDFLFMKGINFLGFEVFNGCALTVKDCVAFNQFDIFN